MFIVTTNLPDGAKLTLTLDDGNYYTGQQTVKVSGGKAESEPFTDDGRALGRDGVPVLCQRVVIAKARSKGRFNGKAGIGEGKRLRGYIILTRIGGIIGALRKDVTAARLILPVHRGTRAAARTVHRHYGH